MLRCLEPFQKDFDISGESTGLHLVLTAKGDVSEKELLDKAGEAGVKICGLSENMVEDSERKATVLLGFGGLTLEQITEGVNRLRKAWL